MLRGRNNSGFQRVNFASIDSNQRKMSYSMKTHGHIAALGAVGVSGGAFLISLLSFAFFRVTPTSGLDYEHAFITRISTAVILAAVIVVHLVFARQLLAHYREHKNKS